MKNKTIIFVVFLIAFLAVLFSIRCTEVFSQSGSGESIETNSISVTEDVYKNDSGSIRIDLLTDSDVNSKYGNKDYISILKTMGYYKDEYVKDLDFRNSILRYQSWNNLVVNGKLDVALKKMILKGIVKSQPDTLPEVVPKGYWIAINKTKRILTIYKDREVHRKCPIAPGREPSFTPEGKLKIVTKCVNPSWSNHGKYSPGGSPNNPLGKRWMGLSPKGGSVYGIHGSNLPYSIGSDASAGCIRMINSEVEEVYEYIPVGTEVWIGTEEKLKGWGIKQS